MKQRKLLPAYLWSDGGWRQRTLDRAKLATRYRPIERVDGLRYECCLNIGAKIDFEEVAHEIRQGPCNYGD